VSALLSHLLLCCRCVGSYAALAGAVVALGWLSLRLEGLPALRLGPWLGINAPLVVVDAGHGGQDGGAVANGLTEKKLALEIAQRVRHYLEGQGLRVQMTREGDVFLPLQERSAMADRVGASALVSLHLNTSVAAPEVKGIETYFSSQKPLEAQRSLQARLSLPPDQQQVQDDRGACLARSIQYHACLATKADDRGVRERNYVVVTHSACPAALVECGFLTHLRESRKLANEAYRDQLAKGIAHGVAEFVKAQQFRPERWQGAATVLANALASPDAEP